VKLIVAIIQPDRLNDVLDVLEKEEIHLVTVSNVLEVWLINILSK
jgi:nitrogen regulatory protein PII